jgi:hypothetical protein
MSYYNKRSSQKKESNPAKTPEDIHLVFCLQSWETGISYYALSTRTSYEDWKKIAEYFEFIRGNSEEWAEEEVSELYGWYTTCPKKIEEILNVKPEFTIEALAEKAKKQAEERKAKEQALSDKIRKINLAFVDAEYPNPKVEQPEEAARFLEGFEKMRVEGEKIENPRQPENIYGGGQWWIIQENWIWKIDNRGSDGDDWMSNNVNTGGAGAIGHRIPFNQEIADLIRSLKDEKKSIF